MFCVLCVNVYCHRVPTQLQLTNISISIYHYKNNGARYTYYHKCSHFFLWSTCYFSHIVIKLEFSRRIFEKYWNITFHENPSSESRFPCVRTDWHEEANSRFSQILRTRPTAECLKIQIFWYVTLWYCTASLYDISKHHIASIVRVLDPECEPEQTYPDVWWIIIAFEKSMHSVTPQQKWIFTAIWMEELRIANLHLYIAENTLYLQHKQQNYNVV
jgi:hypothetical protein